MVPFLACRLLFVFKVFPSFHVLAVLIFEGLSGRVKYPVSPLYFGTFRNTDLLSVPFKRLGFFFGDLSSNESVFGTFHVWVNLVPPASETVGRQECLVHQPCSFPRASV